MSVLDVVQGFMVWGFTVIDHIKHTGDVCGGKLLHRGGKGGGSSWPKCIKVAENVGLVAVPAAMELGTLA